MKDARRRRGGLESGDTPGFGSGREDSLVEILRRQQIALRVGGGSEAGPAAAGGAAGGSSDEHRPQALHPRDVFMAAIEGTATAPHRVKRTY